MAELLAGALALGLVVALAGRPLRARCRLLDPTEQAVPLYRPWWDRTPTDPPTAGDAGPAVELEL